MHQDLMDFIKMSLGVGLTNFVLSHMQKTCQSLTRTHITRTWFSHIYDVEKHCNHML